MAAADRKGKGKAKKRTMKSIEAVDAEAKKVRLEWVEALGELLGGRLQVF